MTLFLPFFFSFFASLAPTTGTTLMTSSGPTFPTTPSTPLGTVYLFRLLLCLQHWFVILHKKATRGFCFQLSLRTLIRGFFQSLIFFPYVNKSV